jgi:hypothetical protein
MNHKYVVKTDALESTWVSQQNKWPDADPDPPLVPMGLTFVRNGSTMPVYASLDGGQVMLKGHIRKIWLHGYNIQNAQFPNEAVRVRFYGDITNAMRSITSRPSDSHSILLMNGTNSYLTSPYPIAQWKDADGKLMDPSRSIAVTLHRPTDGSQITWDSITLLFLVEKNNWAHS